MRTIFSGALSCVPLISHSDGNRLQMSANYLRQALPLVDPDVPYLTTSYHRYVTQLSSFHIPKREDSEIVYSDELCVVWREGSQYKIFRLPNTLWRVQPDENTVCAHVCVKGGLYCYGKNLNVMFIPWNGWNYEDAIVVSESGASKLKSYNIKEYTLTVYPTEVVLKVPSLGAQLKKGDVLFEWIPEPKNLTNVLCGGVEKWRIYVEDDCVVTHIFVYFASPRVLEKHASRESFKQWCVEHSLTKRVEMLKRELTMLPPHLIRHYFSDSYSMTEHPDEVHIRVITQSIHHFSVGDKLGNRAGNKGVCSIIVPDEEVRTEDGWVPDLVLNPLGVVSRMNVGQVLEMYIAFVIEQVEARVREAWAEGKVDKCMKMIEELESLVGGRVTWRATCTTPEELLEWVDRYGLSVELPLYTHDGYTMCKRLLDHYQIPQTKRYRGVEVGYGSMYWIPLVHTAESKFSCRSVGSYDYYLQPTKSEISPTGQRLGEMEVWALLAYEADANLREVLCCKADDVVAKSVTISSMLRLGVRPQTPHVYLKNSFLGAYLHVLGLDSMLGLSLVVDEEELRESTNLSQLLPLL